MIQSEEALKANDLKELIPELWKVAKQAFPQLIDEINNQSSANEKLAASSNFAIPYILQLSNSIDVLGGKRPGFGFEPPKPKFQLPFQNPFDNSDRNVPLGNVFKPVPKKASGGSVQSDGMVYVHAGEDIVPARVTARYKEKGGGVTITGGISFTINPPAGSAMANDPKVFAEAALQHITRRVRRQRELR